MSGCEWKSAAEWRCEWGDKMKGTAVACTASSHWIPAWLIHWKRTWYSAKEWQHFIKTRRREWLALRGEKKKEGGVTSHTITAGTQYFHYTSLHTHSIFQALLSGITYSVMRKAQGFFLEQHTHHCLYEVDWEFVLIKIQLQVNNGWRDQTWLVQNN